MATEDKNNPTDNPQENTKEMIDTPDTEPAKADSHSEDSSRDEQKSPPESTSNPDDTTAQQADKEEQAPENVRRGRLVVFIMGLLVVIALCVIIAMPPLTEVTPKNLGSNFHTPPQAVIIQNPSVNPREIAYEKITETKTFHMELTQQSFYPDNHQIRVSISSNVNMVQPALKDDEHEVAISLSNVSVHVYDDDKEVQLASAGRLLAGISLYTVIDPHRGMSNIVPEPNINPQVRRVLYILTDGIRQIYPALPEQPVGNGATYQYQSLPDVSKRLKSDSVATCIHQNDGTIVNIQTKLTQDTTQAGTGTSSLTIQNGQVIQGNIIMDRTQSMEGADRQHVEISWKAVP